MGNHFHKRNSRLSRGLEKTGADSETKIRVTKNHTNTICKYVINSILGMAPTGAILPKNPTEIQDQKSAEIHASIFEDYKARTKFNAHVRRWAHDFVITGEVFVNVYWDDSLGPKIGYEEVLDPETGEVTGQNFIHAGDVCLERVFAWDVRMDVGAKDFDEASWVGYEKMVCPKKVAKVLGLDEEEAKTLTEEADETFKVFDGQTGDYSESKGKILLRQMYLRPDSEHPNGYFYYFSKEKVLAHGELPHDQMGNVFFPIKYLGFDEIPTSPRSASMIRMIRPDQMEVNRCASAIALTQMTVGFDKMITPAGGTIDANTQKAGIRIIKVPGGKQSTDIIPGRSGEQFLNTMNSSISEMYRKTGVPEVAEEKAQDTDVFAALFKNDKQKLRFSLYSSKFSEFLVDIIETILRLKKAYMRDETFIRVVGKAEYVNIPEFRAMDDIGFQIKIEPSTEDLESRYGKHMTLVQTMQYLGQDMDKHTKGMLLKQMPFLNKEEIHSEYTLEYETARNVMLSLDRGEMPDLVTAGSPDYFLKQLQMRTYKPDFKFLPEMVKLNYQQQVQAYQQLYKQNVTEIQRAQQGFIPADGPQVPVDGMYTETIGSNGQPKSERMKFYLSSLQWLAKQMEAQHQAMGNITTLPLGQQAELAQTYNQGGAEMPLEGNVPNVNGF